MELENHWKMENCAKTATKHPLKYKNKDGKPWMELENRDPYVSPDFLFLLKIGARGIFRFGIDHRLIIRMTCSPNIIMLRFTT